LRKSPTTNELELPADVLFLGMLLAVNAVAFVDRTIIAILAQPIKEDLALSDAQVGLLGGLSFALFYGFLSIPIARLAERSDRIGIIAGCLALWSVATVLCGLAQSFILLLLARSFVGIGEAGSGAPAQALISDRFAADRRAVALSVLALGTPLGVVLGAIVGGGLAVAFGWRWTLIILGAPGIALAILVRLFMRDPRSTNQEANKPALPSLRSVTLQFLANPTMVMITAAGACSSFTAYGMAQFMPAFFSRAYAADPAQAGYAIAMIAAVGSGLGTAIGGVLAQALSRIHPALFLGAPGLALIAATPAYALGFSQTTLPSAAVMLLIPHALQFIWLGAGLASLQNLSPPLGRASVAALTFLVFNIVGLGLGPLVVGATSDFLATRSCQQATCMTAADALRFAMLAGAAPSILGGMLLMLAGLRSRIDLLSVSQTGNAPPIRTEDLRNRP